MIKFFLIVSLLSFLMITGCNGDPNSGQGTGAGGGDGTNPGGAGQGNVGTVLSSNEAKTLLYLSYVERMNPRPSGYTISTSDDGKTVTHTFVNVRAVIDDALYPPEPNAVGSENQIDDEDGTSFHGTVTIDGIHVETFSESTPSSRNVGSGVSSDYDLRVILEGTDVPYIIKKVILNKSLNVALRDVQSAQSSFSSVEKYYEKYFSYIMLLVEWNKFEAEHPGIQPKLTAVERPAGLMNFRYAKGSDGGMVYFEFLNQGSSELSGSLNPNSFLYTGSGYIYQDNETNVKKITIDIVVCGEHNLTLYYNLKTAGDPARVEECKVILNGTDWTDDYEELIGFELT